MAPKTRPHILLSATAALTVAATTAATASSAVPMRTFVTIAVNRVGGEPAVAFNPRNPSHLVFSNLSGIAVSADHGTHWQFVASAVADPQVVADNEGRFYTTAPSDAASPNTLGPGVLIQTSTDNGYTWNKAVQVFPNSGWAEASDRPFLAADLNTGYVYATVARHRLPPGYGQTPSGYVYVPTAQTNITDIAACNLNALSSALLDCGDRIVTATRDGGRTWSRPQPMDSPQWPQYGTGGFNAIPTAAHGVLAAFYYSSQAPGHTCPCLVFETTKDAGAHWKRMVVPNSHVYVRTGLDSATTNPVAAIINDSFTQMWGPYPAADPSRPGHFAVMVPIRGDSGFEVFQTYDDGARWTGPIRVAQQDKRGKELPWLAFSPHGALGAYWRLVDTTKSTFTPWVAVSLSGDARQLERPVQLDSRPAPTSETSDDNSDTKMDDHYVYVTWGSSFGDSKTNGWFARYRYR